FSERCETAGAPKLDLAGLAPDRRADDEKKAVAPGVGVVVVAQTTLGERVRGVSLRGGVVPGWETDVGRDITHGPPEGSVGIIELIGAAGDRLQKFGRDLRVALATTRGRHSEKQHGAGSANHIQRLSRF